MSTCIRRDYVTNSLGIVLPTEIAAIVDDYHKHPERGRLLDRINAYRRKKSASVSGTKKHRHEEENISNQTSKQFSFLHCTAGGMPMIEGRFGLFRDHKITPTTCSGYLVTLSPDDEQLAAIVLDLPGRGLTPCLCPSSLLEDVAIEAIKTYAKEQYDKRKARSIIDMPVESVPAWRGDVEGHLLIGGRKGFKGRIVDSQMLASLKGGCVRTGANSSQSFYTLHRYFCISEKQLDNKAHVVIGTQLGMRVCPGGVREVKSLVQLGGVALNNQLVYHRTIHDTLLALDNAGKLPPPSIDEQVIQISIGGDIDAMMIGNFLPTPCQEKCGKVDIAINCARGFDVDKSVKTSRVKELLRCKCRPKK